MFVRYVDKLIEAWSREDGSSRNVLLVRGVRQCGKSTSITNFLKKSFGKDYVVFNFEKDQALQRVINQAQSFHECLEHLEIYSGIKIVNATRLAIFFDEIQKTPNLMAYLRFFKEDLPAIHVIAAGSYLELHADIVVSFPVGRISHLFMRPMNFEEFLLTRDKSAEIKALRMIIDEMGESHTDIQRLAKLLAPFHTNLTTLALEYEICGGMPAVVAELTKTRSLKKCRRVQNDLISSFKGDFQKYASKSSPDVRITANMVDIALSVLDRVNLLTKGVDYKEISSSHSAETIRKTIAFLESIGLILKVFATNAVDSPLSAGTIRRNYRLFPCDTGLFHALVKSEIPKIIDSNLHFSNDGVLGETYLVCELAKLSDIFSKEHNVFYWENTRTNKEARAELDALFFNRGTLYAIDAKRKRQHISHSMRFFHERFMKRDESKKVRLMPIISTMDELCDLGQGYISVPFYLTPFFMLDEESPRLI